MRYIVFGFILFLPLIVYFTWAYIVSRKMEETQGRWNEGPITRLFVAGLLLMAGALVVSRFMNTGEAPTRIVPKQYSDDRFLRQNDQAPPSAPQAEPELAGPSPSPSAVGETILPGDSAFMVKAEKLLKDFLASGDIVLVDKLATRSDKWGLVLRADYRRRVEGKLQPVQRLIIWQAAGGLVMEMPENTETLAPLSTFVPTVD